MKFGVGQAIKRVEDQVLVTGQGRYTDDVAVEDAAYAYVLRSPHAHAEIRGIDIADAKEMSGVLTILTGADVESDGLGDMPCNIPMKNRDGSDRANTPHPILAKDRVRYVGDPVALVVAETLQQARDAAETIAVDYAELPSVVDTEGAAEDGAPLVWDEAKNNIIFDWEDGDQAAVDKAMAAADQVVALRMVNNRVVANSMEPRACVAEYDAGSGKVTLHTSTQGPHVIYGQIADVVLKIGKENLRIKTGHVGGGFGMKVFLHAEQPLTVWAARKIKRSVRWNSDRSEAFMSDLQGRDNVSYAELAMDADGKFLALRVTTYAAMGAYLSNFAPFVATGGTAMLGGLYMTPAIHVNVKGMATNTVPVDAYRGAGRPEAAYLIERLVDHAARVSGIGPAELRRRNFIPPSAMPYKTPLCEPYDSGEFEAVMAEAMEQSDWEGFEARRAEAAKRGKYRGIGLATYIERCGGGAPETAVAKFEDDGIKIYIGTMENGQGHHTSYKQILSETLDIDADTIQIVQGDTETTPAGMTGGSRSVPVGGAAVLGVGQKIREKGTQIAAHMMEVAPVDIEFADGTFTVAGTDKSMTLWEIAKAAADPANVPEGMEPGLDDEYQRKPEAATFPNGCHVIEVEIDPDTGELEIPRYTVVDDFGKVINPIMLEGQVHGGIVQGLGQALTEHTVYDDESGQLVSGSFMDYDMPKADRFPFFHFSTHNVPCTTNPLGIKGAGEAGAIGAPPAVINAIVDALYPELGIDHIDMPATALAIWQAIHGAHRAAAE